MKEFIISEHKKWYAHYSQVEWHSIDDVISHPRNFTPKTATRAVQQLVSTGVIAPITNRRCVDCGIVAEQYHHYKGYDGDNLYEVIPMCKNCHEAIHAKVRTGVYFEFGIDYSISKHLALQKLTTTDLMLLHGYAMSSTLDSVNRCNLRNKVIWQRKIKQQYLQYMSIHPTARELEISKALGYTYTQILRCKQNIASRNK